jgi:hypothetical protein
VHDEDARRIAVEENYEYKKPKDKEEKRFLRIVAHFDDLLFKESLLGEPIKEGEKSASMPLKFKLQGEGMFAAFFFHVFSLAVYVLFLIIAFWVKYDPTSGELDRAFFTSPLYSYLAALMSAAVLSAVPLLFVRRYVIYPEGYLLVRVKNFLYGYWLALLILLLLSLVRIAVVRLKGEGLASYLLPHVYAFIQSHPKLFILGLVVGAGVLVLAGLFLLIATRKDYLNAVGLVLLVAGITAGVLAGLLYQYGYTPENAQWLVYYLVLFLMGSFSEEAELLSLLLPLSTYLYFKAKVRALERKMYAMPYS